MGNCCNKPGGNKGEEFLAFEHNDEQYENLNKNRCNQCNLHLESDPNSYIIQEVTNHKCGHTIQKEED